MPSLVLDDVSLTFRVRKNGRISLKEFFISKLQRRESNGILRVPALQHIDLQIHDGERLGIIGHNGAGKSTLLQVLAGVYPPTGGRRIAHGRVSSLFSLTLGFEFDASGRDNIRYRGYLQGETPRTLERKIGEIGEFSELGHLLDMPVRYYSSGMLVRLAFAIATAIDPEILIVDEVLSAGDLSFQQKARRRMEDLLERAGMAVIVSHDLGSLAKLCRRIIWLDHGQIRAQGPAAEIIAAYTAQAGQSAPRLAA